MRALAGFSLPGLWASKVPSQTNDAPATEFVIKVPFKFVVGTHTLPPDRRSKTELVSESP
jgi:hypothetical protein